MSYNPRKGLQLEVRDHRTPKAKEVTRDKNQAFACDTLMRGVFAKCHRENWLCLKGSHHGMAHENIRAWEMSSLQRVTADGICIEKSFGIKWQHLFFSARQWVFSDKCLSRFSSEEYRHTFALTSLPISILHVPAKDINMSQLYRLVALIFQATLFCHYLP